jgi:ABC-type phosphate/phosphonate transport system substrate-binding protein
MLRNILTSACIVATILLVGCTEQDQDFSISIFNPDGGEGKVEQEPVRIGVAYQEEEQGSILNPVNWLTEKQTPWLSLQEELSKKLDRPVVVENLQPFQLAAHLESGRLQFAWLPAADYLLLYKEGEIGKVLLISQGATRRGLIVTAATSKVQSIGDLKNRRFAFGPKDDAVLHTGALVVLEEGGITKDDIAKEVLPVPGQLQHHLSSKDVAKEVVYGLAVGELGTGGGVIEEAEYLALPETGGKLLPLPSYSKDQFRILGRTKPIAVATFDDGPLLASKETDPQLVITVREFLLAAATEHTNVMADLGLAEFESAPTSTMACRSLLQELAKDQTPSEVPE